MHVVVAFSPDYGSQVDPELGDAFWLIESTANRALAEANWQAEATDPNSALFKSRVCTVDNSDVLAKFETVDLHHPNWSKIDLIGINLNEELHRAFREEGLVTTEDGNGFSITRKEQ